ncbi:metallophosphoesterase [Bythopirellula goksoeyrii]|uniref:Calcineurin-like phosphoesterase n=1 Tax=Bythopirellula goksoeyrii TaxID=1400387 RepID=A0A5B9QJG3_9BACT|nr:metallophosphoesterase [Bythopirellula goksoeyrii]QEG34243.1 Calcineurin-like phosphoesterase [Bythopirellula goksoeyrii]
MMNEISQKLSIYQLLFIVTLSLWHLFGDAQIAVAEALPIQPGSWTLAVLPDTQDYTEFGLSHFTTQTQWIADHAVSHNIQYVLHEGDVTEHNNTTQWDRGLTSMNILNGVVPYAIAPGNHDYGPSGFSANRNTLFNDPGYFGAGSPYANQASVGGFFEAGKTDNSYHTFSAGGQDWLVLAMEWAPRDSVLTWANQVVTDHPDHQAMLVTHAYMYYDETRYDWATKGTTQQWNPHSYPLENNPGETVNDGQEIWDGLVSQHENFRFTFSGHVLGDGTGFLSSAGDQGNIVHQMLSNYQFKTQGGNGDMRLLEFLPDGETVIVRTYSPVLDRYDTKYDQEFILNLNELREPLAPPINERSVAANLLVGGSTTNGSNAVGPVTVPQSSLPGIGTFQLNRGDYQLSVGGQGMEYKRGILLASITQNLRDGLRATVEAGRNSFEDGLMALSLTQAGAAGLTEVNFNNSVAWFDFRAGWQGAHVNANGSLATDAFQGVDQSMLSKQAAGRYTLDMGVHSQTDGLLFAIGNNNSNVVVQTAPHSDGSGWDLRVQSNVSNFSGTGIDQDFSFLYLPYDTEGLVGGLYEGANDSHISSVGTFTMTRLSAGEYELTIPNESPETGMLILTVSDDFFNGSITAPNDNFLTYEPTLSGSFMINAFDLPSLSMEDTSFSWAFISFDDPLAPATIASADFNEDGSVDGADFLIWQRGVNSAAGLANGDADNSGFVDGDDLAIWQDQYGTDGMNAPLSVVPEPTALLLIVLGLLVPNRIR